jgi:hypothetical protein
LIQGLAKTGFTLFTIFIIIQYMMTLHHLERIYRQY